MSEAVNHPKHYTSHPSGYEAIQVCEHLGFCAGNAVKYLWRCGDKHASPVEDLRKALWYTQRILSRFEEESPPTVLNLPEPPAYGFGTNFFGNLSLTYTHVAVLMAALVYESRGYIAGAMAHIVRGVEYMDPVDLRIAAYYIERAIENAG